MSVVDNEMRLIADACRGSALAFEALVTSYEPRIRRMIYAMTHDVQLTQDLCQETFLAAFRALPRMQAEELHFAPWLYRIALNQVRSEWRRRKHVTLISLSQAIVNNDECDEVLEESLVSAERFEEGTMQREIVEQVLQRLPSSSVQCLLLDAEGFSYKEIATILQESLSAVRSRLSRARQAFQRIYSELNRSGDDEG